MGEVEYNRSYYMEHRETLLARAHERALRKRKLIDNAKAGGCSVCGYNRSKWALHFHHEGDKSFLPADMIWKRSEAALLAEISKCRVVCANCHAEIHELEASSSGQDGGPSLR